MGSLSGVVSEMELQKTGQKLVGGENVCRVAPGKQVENVT